MANILCVVSAVTSETAASQFYCYDPLTNNLQPLECLYTRLNSFSCDFDLLLLGSSSQGTLSNGCRSGSDERVVCEDFRLNVVVDSNSFDLTGQGQFYQGFTDGLLFMPVILALLGIGAIRKVVGG